MTPRQAPKAFENASILIFTVKMFGNHRKVDLSEFVDDNKGVDEKSLNLTKRLLDCPEMRAIAAYQGEIRRYIAMISLASPFKSGVYTVANAAIPQLYAKMEEFDSGLEALKSNLVKVLPEKVKEAKKRLGILFNEDEMPTAKDIRESIGFEFFTLNVEASRGLTPELLKKEQAKIAKQCEEIVSVWRKCLLKEFSDVVNHLVEKTSGSDDGKKKIFRDSTVENVTDFLSVFDMKNPLVNFDELKKEVDKAKKISKGLDPDLLRSDDDIRADVNKKFAAIKANLDKMLIEKPTRGIRFSK